MSGVQFVRTGEQCRRTTITLLVFALGNISTSSPLKLKPEQPRILNLYIEEADTGGTLAVELAILRPQVSLYRSSYKTQNVSNS